MRIFALSDIHVDYDENKQWVQLLSRFDYQNDLLLMAGDVSHDLDLLATTLTTLSERFCTVLFTPGNHDLWVHHHQSGGLDSWHKFFAVRKAAEDCGISTQPVLRSGVLCVPLFGCYGYSFDKPANGLKRQWTDFRACKEAKLFRYRCSCTPLRHAQPVCTRNISEKNDRFCPLSPSN